MQINEAVKTAALEAAHRSWFGNPSFDRAVLLAVEAAFKAAQENAANITLGSEREQP